MYKGTLYRGMCTCAQFVYFSLWHITIANSTILANRSFRISQICLRSYTHNGQVCIDKFNNCIIASIRITIAEFHAAISQIFISTFIGNRNIHSFIEERMHGRHLRQ